MNNQLFNYVEDFLIHDKRRNNHGETFLQEKENMFWDEVCSLVALQTTKTISMKIEIRKVFLVNMYKFNSFQGSMNFIRTQIGDLIRNEIYHQNITKADINDECNDPKNAKIKISMAAILMSYHTLPLKDE